MSITSILVDRRNYALLRDQILAEIRNASFVGLDCETEDSDRHEGLNQFCGYKPDGTKAKNKPLVFDFKRIDICGFSVYAEGSEFGYYFNLHHADALNRLEWFEVREVLEALPETSHFLCHNAAFEYAVFKSCFDYDLPRVIDTLTMAVSAFGDDEYDMTDLLGAGQGGIRALLPDLLRASSRFDPERMPNDLEELIGKITAKQSTAKHSYNGYIKEIAYGYGLKGLVRKFLGHTMTTFEEVLGGKAHMGQLTGEEVVAYGVDDAWAVVPLFHHLLAMMVRANPEVVSTFFDQENPMAKVFADLSVQGVRVNTRNILTRKDTERAEAAGILREMKAEVKAMLPFPLYPHEALAKRDSWYASNWVKYRKQITDWASTPEGMDDFSEVYQTRGPVSNVWAAERGMSESSGVNLSHYMPIRVLIYDLAQTTLIISEGKTQSDGEARGKIKERHPETGKLIDLLNDLAGVEQRMKLYLTPYQQLMDRETGKLHPQVTSMLVTRRMASRYPNPMQLAKRGSSTYVRGFFEADSPDHVLISADWSGQELVTIGEQSGDPEFFKAFGQIPHADLHAGAATSVLSVTSPGLTEDIFRSLKDFEHEDDFRREYQGAVGNIDRLFVTPKGEPLKIGKAFKYWRNTAGKPASFGYWYSGSLFTMGDVMGWDPTMAQMATEAYRSKYPVAEQWRVNTINHAKAYGYVQLPDGHRRVRLEATDFWRQIFLTKFQLPMDSNDDLVTKYNQVWGLIASRIQRRAGNQAVNAMIQGTGATLAKRTIRRIEDRKKERGWGTSDLRFVFPVHDELVYSAHKSIAVEAIHLIRNSMLDHPDLFRSCKLDASPSVGLNFEPWGASAPFGQIELFEAPEVDWLPKETWGSRLNDDHMQAVVDYLVDERKAA